MAEARRFRMQVHWTEGADADGPHIAMAPQKIEDMADRRLGSGGIDAGGDEIVGSGSDAADEFRAAGFNGAKDVHVVPFQGEFVTYAGVRARRFCHQALASVVRRMIAPPASERGAGFSPWASHVQTGLSAGSSSRRIVASKAGTERMPRVRQT